MGLGRDFLLVALVIIAALASCVDDELCIGDGTNVMKVQFIDVDSIPEQSTEITLDSLVVSGTPVNYPAYADTTLSALELEIDPDSTVSLFIFYSPTRIDSLEVTYVVLPRLISPECGPEKLFSELTASRYTFDSVAIEESLLRREVENNVKIYY